MRSAFRTAGEFIAREAGASMGQAFRAVRNSPLAREIGHAAVNEFKMDSFGKDSGFINGVANTADNLPETIMRHALNKNASTLEKVTGITREMIAGTFGQTSKGQIVAGVGQVIMNAIEEAGSRASNNANQISAGLAGLKESLTRSPMVNNIGMESSLRPGNKN